MRNAESQGKVVRCTTLPFTFRIPHSAIRTPHRMKFPDRLPIPDEVLRIAKRLEDAGYETWCRSEEHTSELQSRLHLVCRLLLEKKKKRESRHTRYIEPLLCWLERQ